MDTELFRTAVWRLDMFIKRNLLPDTTFHSKVRADTDFIRTFLKERCFRDATHNVRISKVVMGGSFNQYTVLNGRTEADLVVFFNNLTCFEDQLKRREEFIKEIQKHLCQLQGKKEEFELKFEVLSSEQPDWGSLSFTLSSPQLQQEMKFDVQPAYDALGELRNYTNIDYTISSKIYAQLVRECTVLQKEGEFSICFTELHKNFLKYRVPKLWNAIRLVKHWYQLCQEKLEKPLPPQYALELLTVYAWECGCDDNSPLRIAKVFRTVLELIYEYKNLRVYWTWYYNRREEITDYLRRQLQKARPVILDPADPTRNVAGSDLQAWHLLKAEAVKWVESNFFMDNKMSPVVPCAVPPEKPECVPVSPAESAGEALEAGACMYLSAARP